MFAGSHAPGLWYRLRTDPARVERQQQLRPDASCMPEDSLRHLHMCSDPCMVLCNERRLVSHTMAVRRILVRQVLWLSNHAPLHPRRSVTLTLQMLRVCGGDPALVERRGQQRSRQAIIGIEMRRLEQWSRFTEVDKYPLLWLARDRAVVVCS